MTPVIFMTALYTLLCLLCPSLAGSTLKEEPGVPALRVPSHLSLAGNTPKEEYVYVYAIKGRVTRQTGNNAKELKQWELIDQGTTLYIEKDASVSLSTCGCKKPLKLDHRNSPYTVKVKDIEIDTSKKIFAKILYYAIYYCYPNSQEGWLVDFHTSMREVSVIPPGLSGKEVYLHTRRAVGPCSTLQPVGKVLLTQNPIPFQWQLDGDNFLLEIRESDKMPVLYSASTSSKRIDVPIQNLQPGKEYNWSVREGKTGQKECEATFTLLSEDDSKEKMDALNRIPSLLPPGVDKETICRLQAGYLRSQELEYDAWRWLERNVAQ